MQVRQGVMANDIGQGASLGRTERLLACRHGGFVGRWAKLESIGLIDHTSRCRLCFRDATTGKIGADLQ